MSRLSALLLLALVAFTTTACIVEPMPPAGGPGYDRWCYNHPYRCGRY